jgi:hypothetical protein
VRAQRGHRQAGHLHVTGPERYRFVHRSHVELHLSEWADHDPQRTSAVVYLYVSDARVLRREWKTSGVVGRLARIRDTSYGLREFSFVDADGTSHRVGSPIPADVSSPEH